MFISIELEMKVKKLQLKLQKLGQKWNIKQQSHVMNLKGHVLKEQLMCPCCFYMNNPTQSSTFTSL